MDLVFYSMDRSCLTGLGDGEPDSPAFARCVYASRPICTAAVYSPNLGQISNLCFLACLALNGRIKDRGTAEYFGTRIEIGTGYLRSLASSQSEDDQCRCALNSMVTDGLTE